MLESPGDSGLQEDHLLWIPPFSCLGTWAFLSAKLGLTAGRHLEFCLKIKYGLPAKIHRQTTFSHGEGHVFAWGGKEADTAMSLCAEVGGLTLLLQNGPAEVVRAEGLGGSTGTLTGPQEVGISLGFPPQGRFGESCCSAGLQGMVEAEANPRGEAQACGKSPP